MSGLDFFIGKHIRMFRLSSGLSQSDIARVLGLAPHQIERFENGTVRVSALQLLRTARFLNVPVTAFFDDGPVPAAKDAPSQQIAILSLIKTLPDPQQVAPLTWTEVLATKGKNRPASNIRAAITPLSETEGG